MTLQRLSSTHTRVLAAIQLEADLSATEIARRTRLSHRVAHYHLRRLFDDDVIRPFALVNPHALGLTDYCLFLKPIGHHAGMLQRATKLFQASPLVAFASLLVGEFLFSVSCFGRDIRVVEQLMRELRRALPSVSWDTRFAIRLEWTIFERQYLGKGSAIKRLTRSIDVREDERSDRDMRFLQLLTANPSEPLSRISLSAGVSEATGRAIEKSMRSSGLIIGRACYINPHALGRISYRIVISVTSRSPKVDEMFREYGLTREEISEFVICIGSWDYEYNMQLRDPLDLGRCVADLYDTFRDHIRQIQTMSDAKLLKLHQIGAASAPHLSWQKALERVATY
jgi:DNA-binding Lrp family transcriptional regulator